MKPLSRKKKLLATVASLGVVRLSVGLVVAFVLAVPALRAQQSEDFDSYKIRLDGFWFYSNPSGNVQGSADSGLVDLQKDELAQAFCGRQRVRDVFRRVWQLCLDVRHNWADSN